MGVNNSEVNLPVMQFTDSQDPWTKVRPLQSLILIFFISLIGFYFVGPFVGVLFSLPLYNGSAADFMSDMLNPSSNPDMKLPLYIVQGSTTLIGFIMFPYLYGKYILKLGPSQMLGSYLPSPAMSLLTLVVVILFMGVNSIFIEWNANLSLPEVFSGFENWARDFEERARVFTEYFTTFDNAYELWLGLLVIAILPAIGEELVFRGFIQTHLFVLTKNIHVAIWVAAFIFSFFHFQFFGFLPRLLLGALFGYLYAWSGNIAFPMIAHFANNGFTLTMIYLYNKGALDFDIESTNTIPLMSVLISGVITLVLLYLFKSHFTSQSRSTSDE